MSQFILWLFSFIFFISFFLFLWTFCVICSVLFSISLTIASTVPNLLLILYVSPFFFPIFNLHEKLSCKISNRFFSILVSTILIFIHSLLLLFNLDTSPFSILSKIDKIPYGNLDKCWIISNSSGVIAPTYWVPWLFLIVFNFHMHS